MDTRSFWPRPSSIPRALPAPATARRTGARWGLTRGFAREPGGSARWRHHGQPKEIFVFELTANAAEVLSQAETPAQWHGETRTEPMAALRLRSLFECLGEVPECRLARGKRYPLNTVLALAVAARLAGYRGVTAFARSPACSARNSSRPGARSTARANSATPRPRSPPSTTSSPPFRPRRWTTPSASGPPSTAPPAPRSPWTARMCAAPRSRPKRGAG